MMEQHENESILPKNEGYSHLVTGISELIEENRLQAVRSINNILTATYWEIGRRIVEFEQGGESRAEYGEMLIANLSTDLMTRYGRGFSSQGLYKMRSFYIGWEIFPTPSGKFVAQAKLSTASGNSSQNITGQFNASPVTITAAVSPLSWSHYVRLLSVNNLHARSFYESEAIRGGWSVRQLDRQISTQFFERTVRSKNQRFMLSRGQEGPPEDKVTMSDEVRDPYLLEFLNLKDEYSESDLFSK